MSLLKIKKPIAIKTIGFKTKCLILYITPCANIASATLTKPAILAPFT